MGGWGVLETCMTPDEAPVGSASEEADARPEVLTVPLSWSLEVRTLPRFERPLEVSARQAALLTSAPWVRSPGKVAMDVTVQGWRFPLPPDQPAGPARPPVAKAP